MKLPRWLCHYIRRLLVRKRGLPVAKKPSLALVGIHVLNNESYRRLG